MSRKIEKQLNQIGKNTVKELLETKSNVTLFSFLETYFKFVNREKNRKELMEFIQRYDFTYKTLKSLINFLVKITGEDIKSKVEDFLKETDREYPVDEWFYKNRLNELVKNLKSSIIKQGDSAQSWENAISEVFVMFIKFSKKFIALPEDDYEIFEIEKGLKNLKEPDDYVELAGKFYDLLEKLVVRGKSPDDKSTLFSKFLGKEKGIFQVDDTLKEIITIFVDNMNVFLQLDESIKEKVNILEEKVKELNSVDEAEKFKKVLKEVFFKLEFIKNSVEKEKEELKNIIFLMTDTLKSFIGEGDDFSRHLDSFIEQLKSTDDLNEIKKIKFEIIKATMLIKDKTELMKKELSEANEKMVESQKRLKELEAELDSAKEKALYDGLTGVYNRASFNDRIKTEVEKAKRTGRTLCVMMLDLDHFKKINDNYGHQTGDMVLKILTTQAKKVVRNIDFIARYGGEEFVILLPEITKERALEIAERVRSKIEKTKLIYNKKTFKVTISIGMTFQIEGDSVESLIERADKALYEAKRTGRNKVVLL